MRVYKLLTAMLLVLLGNNVNAATILLPTDGTINFIVPQHSTDLIAVFDNNDDLANGVNATLVNFDSMIPAYFCLPALKSGQIARDVHSGFVVGLSVDHGSSWLEDTGFWGDSESGSGGILGFGYLKGVFISDARVSPVPAPSSLWLFGSGLLGLAGMVRRYT